MDTHRDAHVAGVLSLVGEAIGTKEFPASAAGYRNLLGWARASGMVRRAGQRHHWPGLLPQLARRLRRDERRVTRASWASAGAAHWKRDDWPWKLGMQTTRKYHTVAPPFPHALAK